MEGILKGKMNKIYKEICLMEQPWIDDDKSSLSKVAPQVKVLRFVRWLVGEGEADEASAEE
jgi:elongation factor Ts